MKQFREDLFAFLSGTAAITAVVGSGSAARIFPIVTPSGVSLPYVTVTQVSTSPEYGHDGRSTVHREGYQFDCVAATPAEAQTLSDAIVSALEIAIDSTLGSASNLHAVELFDEQDDFDLETKRFRRLVDLSLQYTLNT